MRGRRGGLLLGEGRVGLAASPGAAPVREAGRVRIERMRRRSPDPVAPFHEAPCYAPPPGGDGPADPAGG